MSCIGKGHYEDSYTTSWYGFNNKPISQDTRCEYCYKKILDLDPRRADSMYMLASHTGRIDCDSITDSDLASMMYKGFSFKVLSGDKSIPYLVHAPKANNRTNGVYTVEMPETADYCIEIEKLAPQHSGGFSFQLANASQASNQTHKKYYTFEMSVGERKVIVNQGKVIYYNGKVSVSGFETGKNANFKFIANKPGVSSSVSNTDPNSNIITITINEYKRIPKIKHIEMSIMYSKHNHEPQYKGGEHWYPCLAPCGDNFGSSCRSGTGEEEDTSLGSDGLFGSNNSSSLEGSSGSRGSSSNNAAMLDSMVKQAKADEQLGRDLMSRRCGSGGNKKYGSRSLSSASRVASTTAPEVFKGRTEQGNKYVPTVATSTTEDEFVLVSGFVASIQLIHVDGKNNLSYVNRKLEEVKKEQDRLLDIQRNLLNQSNLTSVLPNEQPQQVVDLPPLAVMDIDTDVKIPTAPPQVLNNDLTTTSSLMVSVPNTLAPPQQLDITTIDILPNTVPTGANMNTTTTAPVDDDFEHV